MSGASSLGELQSSPASLRLVLVVDRGEPVPAEYRGDPAAEGVPVLR